MKDDRRLDSDSQRQAADWVRGLPKEEEPSLSWRAALNESVRQEAARRARRRWRWTVLSPSLGLAATAALAVALLIMPHNVRRETPAGSRLEAGLISLYQDSVRTADVVGVGLRPSEAPASDSFGLDPMQDLDTGAL